jgi:CBS domain-containing protein
MPRSNGETAVGDVVARAGWDASPGAWAGLGRLLRSEGVDLSSATACDLARGTPVYVEADACVLEVQRMMARYHIRSVPVLRAAEVIGIVDLVELALSDDLLS